MRGRPHWPKCRKCRRGMYGHLGARLGIKRTGVAQGRKGQIHCLDCGHKWFSTDPGARRKAGVMGPVDDTR